MKIRLLAAKIFGGLAGSILCVTVSATDIPAGEEATQTESAEVTQTGQDNPCVKDDGGCTSGDSTAVVLELQKQKQIEDVEKAIDALREQFCSSFNPETDCVLPFGSYHYPPWL